MDACEYGGSGKVVSFTSIRKWHLRSVSNTGEIYKIGSSARSFPGSEIFLQILTSMPLDEVGRRYAQNLFSKSLEEIVNRQMDESTAIRADFAKRNLLTSGLYFAAMATANIKQIELLAQAKADTMLKAYERSGVPFDDVALQEITAEITELCNSQHTNAILSATQNIHQGLGDQAVVSGVQDAIVRQIDQGVSSLASRVTRELRIKRDEMILGKREARKAYAAGVGKEWDAFICHASEDKEEFVRPLANALQESGLRIWYDEFTLKIGDSLRAKIDDGLAHSRFGIVVLSKNFFAKQWPQNELDGLVSKEVVGLRVILPVWHAISADDVRRNSPTLAGRLAAKSSDRLVTVVRQLRDAMGL